MLGSHDETYVEDNYPNAKMERFNNYSDSTAALLSNKIDYAVMNYTSALNFVRNNEDLEVATGFLTDEKYCLGINKNNPKLAKQVSEIVDKYLADGTMNEIISHWIKTDGSDYAIVDLPKLKNAPLLKVAIDATREPIDFVSNGKFVVLDIEQIDRIAYELGYTVEYSDMTFAAVITATGSNKADICMGIYALLERRAQILFTSPYFPNPQVMIAKKEDMKE